MTTTRWTHTATITAEYPVGAIQFGRTVAPGTRVILFQDPAQQQGGLITFMHGNGTGVVRLSDITDVAVRDTTVPL